MELDEGALEGPPFMEPQTAPPVPEPASPLYYSSPSGEVRVSQLPCYTDEQREAGAASSSNSAGGDLEVAAQPCYCMEVTLPTPLRES
eukprot:2513874-Amphidinium_carterae.1